MSILDELKKQAKDKNSQTAQDQSQTLQNYEINWHLLAPKVHLIFNYLKELADNLNIVKSEDRCSYSLTKTIEFKNLKKQDFRISKGEKDSIRSFSFRFDLTGERAIQVIINNLAEAEKIRNKLTEHTIRFTDTIESPNRIVFMVSPKITARFEYTADVVNRLILLKIDNFEGSWSQMIRYSPDMITDALMDETAKYILNKPNKFREMSGNTVSEEMRAKLQEKLQRGRNPQNESKPQEKPDKTTSKLMGLFKK